MLVSDASVVYTTGAFWRERLLFARGTLSECRTGGLDWAGGLRILCARGSWAGARGPEVVDSDDSAASACSRGP
ncbi:hypothetical protein GCM10022244_12140 [Streptomyces gulbargensis]|uniref:Uncharacterized protein n=1 Tax=Streptomyces gulbargensis TaxID=364901 RepID=A0ABP7LP57_9ACTN